MKGGGSRAAPWVQALLYKPDEVLEPTFKKNKKAGEVVCMGGRDRRVAWNTEPCRNVEKLYLSTVERISS